MADARRASRLYEAIKAKITAQAEYVVWRDSVVPLGRPKNGPRTRTILPNEDPGKRTAERWRKAFCKKGAIDEAKIAIIDKEKIAREIETAQRRSQRICEQEKDGTVRGTEGTGEFERYTPGRYVEAAREVLGQFDLDPASNETAQVTVRAARYFTPRDNGLQHEWHGRVWLNPPYAQPLIWEFVEKLVAELSCGRVTEAILLTHNYTDTAWFHLAESIAALICFTRGRIKFTDIDGEDRARLGLPAHGVAAGGDPAVSRGRQRARRMRAGGLACASLAMRLGQA